MPRLINGNITFNQQHERPAFLVYDSSNQGSGRFADWEVTVTDTGGCIERVTPSGSYSRTRFTAPVKGIYHFSYFNIGPNATSISRMRLYKNGSLFQTGELRVPTTSTHGYGEKTNIVQLVAGDYIEFFAENDANSFGWYQAQYSGCCGFMAS